MMILDAGAFIAVENQDRDVMALLKLEKVNGRVPITSGAVVAQVWRGGTGKQATVARLLAGTDVKPVDEAAGRFAGVLLGAAGTSDAVDAAVVCLARDGDGILTSDVGDLKVLAEALGVHVDLVLV